MSRPTPGREASAAMPGAPARFPRVLASALDRTAHGTRPAVVLGSVAEPLTDDPSAPSVPVGPGRVARPVRPGRMALVTGTGPAGPDTPDDRADHLIGTVDPAALPLWRDHLAGGDPAARRRLVEFHAPLVRGVAGKLVGRLPSSVELADLLQSGTFGLMDAVDRFDPARGIRFDGYAAQRVRGAMLDELRSQDWVPRTVRSRVREVERARAAVQARTGRPATERELAGELGVALRELRQIVRPVRLVSADDPHGGTAPGGSGVTALPADDADDPLLAAVRRETGAELRAAIAQLGERDRTVLRLYYLEDHTLAEIGVLLGVTESRVCQLHARMVTRLRVRLAPRPAG